MVRNHRLDSGEVRAADFEPSATQDVLADLTDEQRAAVTHDGPLALIAGPGTGKTRVLSRRVAWLVRSRACDAHGIVAVAFSSRAASELRHRMCELLGAAASRVTVCTFHSLGLAILREHGRLLGYVADPDSGGHGRAPRVLDPTACDGVLCGLLPGVAERLRRDGDDEAARCLDHFGPDALGHELRRLKQTEADPLDALAETAPSATQRVLVACVSAYESALKARGCVDFADLIGKALLLLRRPEVGASWCARFQHVLVDEAQDASALQYQLVRTLVAGCRQLTLAGDPDQSIYGFNHALGAHVFDDFCADFPHARAFHLRVNHRSAPGIVQVASALIGRQADTVAHAAGAKQPVALVRAGSEHDEAQLAAEVLADAVQTGVAPFKDCAVLCRTNEQLGTVEGALLRAAVPHVVAGRGGFWHSREVRDVLAYLALSQDSALREHAAARRVLNRPDRGIDAAAIEKLRGPDRELTLWHLLPDDETRAALDLRAQAGLTHWLDTLHALQSRAILPPTELIDHIVHEAPVRYESQLDGAAARDRIELLRRLAHGHATVGAFLREVETASGEDPLLPQQDQAALLTIHAAKGLEFKLVVIVGLNDGLLPHRRAHGQLADFAEEKRLLYTALTRASDRVVLTYAQTRRGAPAEPSPFLRGLPREVIHRGLPDFTAAVSEVRHA